MTKYRNRKTEVDGVVFDSAKEAKRWHELKLLERIGEITDLKRQVPFPLVVNDVQVAKLIADFTYSTKSGLQIVEDTKSDMTRKLPVWRLKSKMFAAQYGFQVTEV